MTSKVSRLTTRMIPSSPPMARSLPSAETFSFLTTVDWPGLTDTTTLGSPGVIGWLDAGSFAPATGGAAGGGAVTGGVTTGATGGAAGLAAIGEFRGAAGGPADGAVDAPGVFGAGTISERVAASDPGGLHRTGGGAISVTGDCCLADSEGTTSKRASGAGRRSSRAIFARKASSSCL